MADLKSPWGGWIFTGSFIGGSRLRMGWGRESGGGGWRGIPPTIRMVPFLRLTQYFGYHPVDEFIERIYFGISRSDEKLEHILHQASELVRAQQLHRILKSLVREKLGILAMSLASHLLTAAS